MNSSIKTIKVSKADADRFIASYEELFNHRKFTNKSKQIMNRKSSTKRIHQVAAVVPIII